MEECTGWGRLIEDKLCPLAYLPGTELSFLLNVERLHIVTQLGNGNQFGALNW